MKNIVRKFKIKEDKVERIKSKYKIKYFVEETGYTIGYLSNVFSGKRCVPKNSAFAITKCIDKNAEVEDYFEE